MRLILSRKGFDSAAGGKASPIFPDGKMISLPIPERGSGTRYDQVQLAGYPLGELVQQLTRGKVRSDFDVHLDPDLSRGARDRRPGWRPSLGQVDAAQGALRNAGVSVGDLFLFFGWFQDVEERDGHWAVRRGSPSRHVLFGWLQIAQILQPGRDESPDWAHDHPHIHNQDRGSNTLYIAADELRLDGLSTGLAGAGTFPHFHEDLCLTGSGERLRSTWHLPDWFLPGPDRPPLGYHADENRWTPRDDGKVELKAAARGQEFVLDLEAYPEAIAWAHGLIAKHAPPH